MQLVEQHIIDKSDPRWSMIDAAAFKSKNIYNAANYRIRQQFLANGAILAYETLEKQFKKAALLADQQLPLKVVQQTLKQVAQDWKSFETARREYAKDPDKFTGRPALPHYKDKVAGRSILVYTVQALSRTQLQKGIIQPSALAIEVKTQQTNIDQVRIVPRKNYYVVEVVYSKPIVPNNDLNPAWAAGSDLGVDNLIALTSNKPGFVPLLVNGRAIKSINQFYNQRLADLKSRLPEGQYTSNRIDALTVNRNRQIQHELHTLSRRLIEHLLAEHIGTLVIGKNVGWKQDIEIGAVHNQKFVQIPHACLIEILTYKAELVGIKVVLIEESYTSKCSFLDLEPVQKHERYAGKRIKRGLFRANDARLINADVNGSYNILRKALPKAFADGIGAVVVQPVRVFSRVQTKGTE